MLLLTSLSQVTPTAITLQGIVLTSLIGRPSPIPLLIPMVLAVPVLMLLKMSITILLSLPNQLIPSLKIMPLSWVGPPLLPPLPPLPGPTPPLLIPITSILMLP